MYRCLGRITVQAREEIQQIRTIKFQCTLLHQNAVWNLVSQFRNDIVCFVKLCVSMCFLYLGNSQIKESFHGRYILESVKRDTKENTQGKRRHLFWSVDSFYPFPFVCNGILRCFAFLSVHVSVAILTRIKQWKLIVGYIQFMNSSNKL